MDRFGDKVCCNPTVKLKKQESYPVIDIDKITPGYKAVRSVASIEYTGQGGAKFQDHDVLFARITPCLENGKMAIADTEGQNGIGSTELFVFRGIDGVSDTDYVYYLLRMKHIRQLAANSMTGASGRQRADMDFIKRIQWDFPDLEIQKKIASVLSVYDNLIEVNNKRIKVLEQMAENLYKEWFVRFRFPGHETAEFENGIPKGWQISRMEDFCYVTDGTHDTPKPTENGVPLVTGKFIEDGEISFDEAYFISEADHEAIKQRSGLSTGDILFSNIGTVGKSCIVDYQREFSVKNVIIFKPDGFNKSLFLYYWLTSPTMQEIFSTQTNGASQQFVGLTFMRKYKIMVPPQTVVSAFVDQIYPIYQLQVMLRNNRKKLIKQRNLLLPRLMSGKLEV